MRKSRFDRAHYVWCFILIIGIVVSNEYDLPRNAHERKQPMKSFHERDKILTGSVAQYDHGKIRSGHERQASTEYCAPTGSQPNALSHRRKANGKNAR